MTPKQWRWRWRAVETVLAVAAVVVLLGRGTRPRSATSPAGEPAVVTEAPTSRLIRDQNRVFLLVANVFPAVLGTMIWAVMDDPPETGVVLIGLVLIVVHFSLDLLYLKTNLEPEIRTTGARYGWVLFTLDLLIVGLMRGAFAAIETLEDRTGSVLWSPIFHFAVIYVLYVLWEVVYDRTNDGGKKTPRSSVRHYFALATWFAACFTLQASTPTTSNHEWTETVAVVGFLIGLAAACVELYWSLFLADRSR